MRTLAPLLVALFAGLLVQPGDAHACAACACGDPTMTVMGTGKSFAGRLRFSGEWRRRAESQPGAFGPDRVVEDRFTAGMAYAPIDGAQIAVTVPVVDRVLDTATLARHRATHIGDVDVLGRLILLGARGRARHQFGLTAGLRLPTGPEVTGADGHPLPLDAQPGNGAFMPTVGAFYGLFAHPWSGHASLGGVVSTEGYAGFTPGPALLGTAFGQYQWGSDVALRLGADGRWTGQDSEHGQPLDPSGGPTVFATGGVVFEAVTDTLLHLTARWPVLDERREGARAGPSLSAGLTHDL